MSNRLASETSPYLLQHAENPVDWYPWGDEALEKARAEDKPILVSIGYSACHWCHVMAHESFEDPEIAAEMNRLFVNIKVDREERPDLDSIYMAAVQAMTGHGGWPLTAFLTPDGVPFYGGTYFPPDDRGGMPGFPKVLAAVADAYENRRAEVDENAEQIKDLLGRASGALPAPELLNASIMTAAAEQLARSFDARNGGFGSAPKFPQPAIIEFLIREWKRSGNQRSEVMARRSLDRMAAGGIYDQIGGGFHRYAVDAIWLVPHFEKMLYDNAQLVSAYLSGYQAFDEERYRRVAEETLDFVARELTSPTGGFFSTLDADSEGREGAFYVWTADEIDAALSAEDSAIARAWFGVTDQGNFEGTNVISTPRRLQDVAETLNADLESLPSEIARMSKNLLEARERRERPGRDDKVIASWNGMMLKAFADGSRILDRDDFREIAVKNARFLLEEQSGEGKLWRSWKDGRASIGGFLEDYANVIDGLLALYRATLDEQWVLKAVNLLERMRADFIDDQGAAFFDTARDHETPVARPRDLHDGATPSGNAVATDALLRIGTMTGDSALVDQAVTILRAMVRTMNEHPIAAGRYLCALDFYLGPVTEVALAGDVNSAELQDLLSATYRVYAPNLIAGHAAEAEAERFPFLAHRPARNGQATAYVCEHFACMAPVHDAASLLRQLEQGIGVSWREF